MSLNGMRESSSLAGGRRTIASQVQGCAPNEATLGLDSTLNSNLICARADIKIFPLIRT